MSRNDALFRQQLLGKAQFFRAVASRDANEERRHFYLLHAKTCEFQALTLSAERPPELRA